MKFLLIGFAFVIDGKVSLNCYLQSLSYLFPACIASPVDFRWNLLSDDEGRMHLIDVAPIEAHPEPAFNAEADTRFLLFTRLNPTGGQRISWTAASISSSNFNAAHPTRLLIHGYNSGPNGSMNTASTAGYLQRGHFNVIV